MVVVAVGQPRRSGGRLGPSRRSDRRVSAEDHECRGYRRPGGRTSTRGAAPHAWQLRPRRRVVRCTGPPTAPASGSSGSATRAQRRPGRARGARIGDAPCLLSAHSPSVARAPRPLLGLTQFLTHTAPKLKRKRPNNPQACGVHKASWADAYLPAGKHFTDIGLRGSIRGGRRGSPRPSSREGMATSGSLR